jgi:hygromycin-B 7''-O-kinase
MSPQGIVYSKHLGCIVDEQFQAALDHFNLGRFIRAEPIPFGLFGQNVFVTSTEGEFVLRGRPHFWWQFQTEQFFTRFLHERTPVPAAWPYLIDSTTSIFGWNYAFMPRMPGLQLADPQVREQLAGADRSAIARTLGETLALMQAANVPSCGRYNAATGRVDPFDLAHELAWPFPVESDAQLSRIAPTTISFSERVKTCLRRELANAQITNAEATTQADMDWVEECIADAGQALDDTFEPAIVIQDYKRENLVVTKNRDRWQVSGVFDLMDAHFGDGEASLSRQYAIYMDTDRDVELAREFLHGYLARNTPRPGFAKRFPIYMLLDRAIIWAFVQRHDRAAWDKQQTFRKWSSPYISLADII